MLIAAAVFFVVVLAAYVFYQVMRVVFLCVLAAGVAMGLELKEKEKNSGNVIEGNFHRVR